MEEENGSLRVEGQRDFETLLMLICLDKPLREMAQHSNYPADLSYPQSEHAKCMTHTGPLRSSWDQLGHNVLHVLSPCGVPASMSVLYKEQLLTKQTAFP